jgi:putative tricarboxylic transport membrane protein
VYRVGSIAPLLLGVACLFYSYSLSLGRITNPGPGLWPFVLSTVIVVVSLVLLFTERSGEDYESFTGKTWLVAAGALSTGVFIYLFQWFGFIVPAFLTLVFWLRFLGEESWVLTLSVATLVTVGFYVLFATLLGIPLPESVLM